MTDVPLCSISISRIIDLSSASSIVKKKISGRKSAHGKTIPISFINEHADFSLRNSSAIKQWLDAVAKSRKKNITLLSYTFVSDKKLLKINQDFLQHDTYTDIITFDYSVGQIHKHDVSGEIYISVDRVRDNAKQFASSFKDELLRVMAHGLLHLCGLGDKSVSESKRMRSAEENALALRHF